MLLISPNGPKQYKVLWLVFFGHYFPWTDFKPWAMLFSVAVSFCWAPTGPALLLEKQSKRKRVTGWTISQSKTQSAFPNRKSIQLPLGCLYHCLQPNSSKFCPARFLEMMAGELFAEILWPDISIYFLQHILIVHLTAPGLCFVLFLLLSTPWLQGDCTEFPLQI